MDLSKYKYRNEFAHEQSNCAKLVKHVELEFITKTSLFKYTENFTTKNENFSDKNTDIFHMSAQNIDCVYSLEPPRRGGSNEYHNLSF